MPAMDRHDPLWRNQFLTKEAKLLLNDNHAGKVEGIHLMIGRRPYAAFGNSTEGRCSGRKTEHCALLLVETRLHGWACRWGIGAGRCG
jgi:hypothetical protein